MVTKFVTIWWDEKYAWKSNVLQKCFGSETHYTNACDESFKCICIMRGGVSLSLNLMCLFFFSLNHCNTINYYLYFSLLTHYCIHTCTYSIIESEFF